MQFPADLFIKIRGDYCRKSESSDIVCLIDYLMVTDAQNICSSEEFVAIY